MGNAFKGYWTAAYTAKGYWIAYEHVLKGIGKPPLILAWCDEKSGKSESSVNRREGRISQQMSGKMWPFLSLFSKALDLHCLH
jgi:hypothetical protein